MTQGQNEGDQAAGSSATELIGDESDAQRSASAGAPGNVPDFFIIGHQKCGTTALYFMLKDHPQIFLPQYKEPRFFAPELRPAGVAESPDRPQTLERYLALFAEARPGQRVGETSPQYIRSPTAARRIAELAPDARIIAILREPAAFLRSYHMQMVASHVEDEKDFRRAVELEPHRRGAGADGSFVRPQLLYSEHVRYVEQLRRFHEVFPADRTLILIYDDFRRDNTGTVRQVQRFLEVDDTLPLQTVDTKPLVGVRSMRLHQFRRAVGRADSNPGAAGPLMRAISTFTPSALRRTAISGVFRRVAYTTPAPPDERFMRELRRRFKPEVEAVSSYLQRDLLSLWKYDSLD